MSKRLLAIVALTLVAGLAQAQGVYVTEGKNGPVFSDKAQPGAREVVLPPINVMTPPPPAAAASAAPDEATRPVADALPGYRSFAIVWPENDGSVVANTALFEVRVAVDPPLRLGDGHAYAVSINGRAVDQRYTASEFMIPPEFWGDELPPPNQPMQLEARIVDGAGRVLKSADPVRFFLRHAVLRAKPKPTPLPAR